MKCPNCGFEDEGHYCSKCGAELSSVAPTPVQETEKVPEGAHWYDKCPVCKSGRLSSNTKKSFLGLVSTEEFECDGCNSVFRHKRGKIELSYVKDTKNSVWEEYKGNPLGEREWINITYGGMSDVKQRESDREFWMSSIKEGKTAIIMPHEAPIILKKDEALQLALPNIALHEPRAVRTGTYGGPSFRVMKGLSIRVGAFRAESHEELKIIDQGIFTLTNKRIVFSGSKRTVDFGLNKILSMEPYSDGIAIHRSGKQKTEYYTGIVNAGLQIKIDGRSYIEPFTGLILMYAIEGLVKKL